MDTDSQFLPLGEEKKTFMIVYEMRKGKNGTCYVAATVMLRLLKTLVAISFPRRAVLKQKKDMIKDSLDCS